MLKNLIVSVLTLPDELKWGRIPTVPGRLAVLGFVFYGFTVDLARRCFCRYNAAMSWMVYILRCADNSLYVGCTNRLEERVQKHNAGKGAKYTAGRRPVRLVYSEPVPDRGSALRRELRLKKLRRSQKLALIHKGAEAQDA